MNVTLDDNSPQLAYSPEWRVQPPNDPDIGEFFQSTYHAAEDNGASMTLTFNGTGIWLYGSKGPFHGQYSVQYTDGQTNAIETFSGFSSTVLFQQVLFGKLLGQGVHTIALRNVVTASDQSFLDLDYVVVQNDTPGASTTNPGFFTSTPKPKGLGPTPTSGTGTSSNGSQNYSPVLMALTIVFGTLTALGLLGLLFFLFRRRRRQQAKLQQHTKPIGSRRSRITLNSNPSRTSAAATLQLATQQAWKDEERQSKALSKSLPGVPSKASRATSPSSGSALSMTERGTASPVTTRGHAPGASRDFHGPRGHTPSGSRDIVTSALIQQHEIDQYRRGEKGRQYVPVGVGADGAGESYQLHTFPTSSSSPRTQSPGGVRALSPPPPRQPQSPTLGHLHHERERAPDSPPLTYQPLSPVVPTHPPLPGVAERHPLLPVVPRSPPAQQQQSFQPQSPRSPPAPTSPSSNSHADRYSAVPSSRLDRNSSFNLTAAERSALSRAPERHYTPSRQPPSIPAGSRPYSLGKMPEEFLASPTPVMRTERLESVSEAGSDVPLTLRRPSAGTSDGGSSPQRHRPPAISTGREYLTADDEALGASFTPDERSFTGSGSTTSGGRPRNGYKGVWKGN